MINKSTVLVDQKDSWLILYAILGASFLGTLDTTIVNIGLYSIQGSFGISIKQVQLVSSIYIFVFSLFLIFSGKLGDHLGYYKIFNVGVGGFLICSFLCGISNSFSDLVICRGVQAFFAALMTSQVLAIIKMKFTDKKSIGLSLYGVTLGAASISGMFIGGYILYFLGWSYIFFVNIPICMLILLTTINKVEKESITKENNNLLDFTKNNIKIYLILFLMLSIMCKIGFCLKIGFWGMLYIVIFMLFLCILKIKVSTYNVGYFSIIKNFSRITWLGLFSLALYFIGTAGFNIITVYFLQNDMLFSQVFSGNISSLLGIGFMLGSLLSGKSIVHYGVKLLVFSSLAIIVNRFFVILSLLALNKQEFIVIFSILLFLTGVAQGFFVSPVINMVINSVDGDISGTISGVALTICNLAIALGQIVFMSTYEEAKLYFSFENALIVLYIMMIFLAILMLVNVSAMISKKG